MRDRHHILNNRLQWTSSKEAAALRSTPQLIPRTDRMYHEGIHHDCPTVPLLGYHTLHHTLNNFEPGGGVLRTVDNLMSAIERAARHPRAHPVDVELARLAVFAIDLQKPYIREGIRREEA